MVGDKQDLSMFIGCTESNQLANELISLSLTQELQLCYYLKQLLMEVVLFNKTLRIIEWLQHKEEAVKHCF